MHFDSFNNILQDIVFKHPTKNITTIVSKLWGENKLHSKVKLMYRFINPNDRAHLNPVDLPRLIEILNEGLSPEDKATKGGDALIHYLCKRADLVAVSTIVRKKKFENHDVAETLQTILNFAATLSSILLDKNRENSSQFIQEVYRVHASLFSLEKLFVKKPLHRR
jgi:hypothetical protein